MQDGNQQRPDDSDTRGNEAKDDGKGMPRPATPARPDDRHKTEELTRAGRSDFDPNAGQE